MSDQSTMPLGEALAAVDADLGAAASHEPSAADNAAGEAAQKAVELSEANFNAWLIRFASALNITASSMRQGGHDEWTTEQARKVLVIMRELDSIASGEDDGGIVPSGFGPLVRTKNARDIIKAMAATKAV